MQNSHSTVLFPCNLISEVLGTPIIADDLPSDIEQSIHYAFSLLSSPRAEEVLTLYFKNGFSQKEICEKLQCSKNLIHIVLGESIEELSLGNRPMLFTHGYTYCTQNRVVGPWLLTLVQEVDPELFLELPIFELGFNGRILNSLSRLPIDTVRDLTQRTELELMKLRNMGTNGIIAIKTRLAELGLSLAT